MVLDHGFGSWFWIMVAASQNTFCLAIGEWFQFASYQVVHANVRILPLICNGNSCVVDYSEMSSRLCIFRVNPSLWKSQVK